MQKLSETDAVLEASKARGHPPNHDTWGILLSEDVEFDVGSFLWFPSQAEMLDFIWKILPYLDPHDSDEATAMALRAIVSAPGRVPSESARDALNQTLSRQGIEWWGTFHDLCVGQDEEPTEVRSRFRYGREESGHVPRPIDQAEIDEFYEFLLEYGD